MGQTGDEASKRFTYLIENGARTIRENEFERVLDMIGELPSEKKIFGGKVLAEEKVE
jgi:hypothetical protein